jgi:HSP20 family protein
VASEKEEQKGLPPARGRGHLWPEEMERFMGLGPWGWPRRWRRRYPFGHLGEWRPDIDVFEREGKIVVRADLPGMKREDIEVSVEDDALVIRGKRQEEKEVKEENYYYAERASGEFSRSIRLPEGVTAEAITASYKDGTLEVEVARPAAPAPKRLNVEIA